MTDNIVGSLRERNMAFPKSRCIQRESKEYSCSSFVVDSALQEVKDQSNTELLNKRKLL